MFKMDKHHKSHEQYIVFIGLLWLRRQKKKTAVDDDDNVWCVFAVEEQNVWIQHSWVGEHMPTMQRKTLTQSSRMR